MVSAGRMSKQSSVVSSGDTYLDPNHTHFILVDDGSESQFGKEIEFRANLENELRKGRTLRCYQQKRLKSNINPSRSLNRMTSNEDEDDDLGSETVPVMNFLCT